jgi:hypothetical protein
MNTGIAAAQAAWLRRSSSAGLRATWRRPGVQNLARTDNGTPRVRIARELIDLPARQRRHRWILSLGKAAATVLFARAQAGQEPISRATSPSRGSRRAPITEHAAAGKGGVTERCLELGAERYVRDRLELSRFDYRTHPFVHRDEVRLDVQAPYPAELGSCLVEHFELGPLNVHIDEVDDRAEPTEQRA